MATRKLKLPDGETMDLAIPEGFGNAEELGLTPASKSTMYLIGAAFGAVAGFVIVYLATRIGEAIERK
jgi:hypothetical protein